MTHKRSNGEGTIYRRKDGRYEGAIFLLTTSGIRKRIRKYGQTRQEVHDKLTAAKMQAQQGIRLPDRTWKLSEYMDYWLEYGVQIKRRPLTYRRHETVVRLYLKPELGHYTLSNMSVHTVQEYLDRLYAETQSAATVHQVRKVLSAALTYAMRQELVIRNVARLVELPSYKPDEAPHWAPIEAVRFLQAARSDPLYPAFVLLVLYGLRRGEVLGLRWCDIDFELGILHVRQQVQRIGGKLRQVPLKTQASERDEPLLETARTVLRQQFARQTAVRAEASVDWQGAGTSEELVFTTCSGLPVESHNLARSFQRICERHGIRRITVHGMRHTNATAQKNLHVHARDIQAILGHGDVRTTGIYEHVDLASKRGALEKVEQQFFMEKKIGSSGRCRQLLPSSREIVAYITAFIFGGASQTRTGDTRLFSSPPVNRSERFAEVNRVVCDWRRQWLVGLVAVSVAVNCHLEEAAIAGSDDAQILDV